MAISSEYHAYNYIKNELSALGWNVANPTRRTDGEVYTQNECLQNSVIKSAFVADKPENVVVVRESKFWVIEAKPLHSDIEKAIQEAKDYADKLNRKEILAPLISAVAGNDEDTYIVKNYYLYKGNWEPVIANGKELTGLASKETAQYLIDHNTNEIKDFNLPDEIYYAKAKKINEILHIGSINKNYRARIMSAILLALSEDTPLNLDSSALVLIKEINARVEQVLHKHGKREFSRSIEITEPPTPDNHIKFRRALIDTIQELKGINIRSAMNSGTDILGRFYEIFLKYGNGAKEIGIVLTPRHITKFGVRAIGVNRDDVIFDPACGTGGFLVASFDYVKRFCTPKQLNVFKQKNIYGIEQEPEVMALALVNMIFRGDGKNNIIEGNCFTKSIPAKATKVLMNPPFALKQDDAKEHKFIDRALEQMDDKGLMFVVIPSTIMFKGQKLKAWRKKLLANNTLKAVIKLPEDLFYPVGVHTSAVVIQKGIPHKMEDNVFWGYLDDGYIKKKGIMKKAKDGNLDEMLSSLRAFLDNPQKTSKSLPKQYQIKPIEAGADLECAPEYYLEEDVHTKTEITGAMNLVFFNLFNHLLNSPIIMNIKEHITFQEGTEKIQEPLDTLFDIINAKSSNIEDYSNGEIPFVTSTELNNGVEKYVEKDDNSLVFDKPCITLSSFGFATVQIPPFIARSHGAVLVLRPKQKLGLIELIHYASQINLQRWRFSYGRWVTKKRLLKLEIKPFDSQDIPSPEYYKDMVNERFKKTNKILL